MRTGRPHWIVAEEAHQLMPATWRPSALVRTEELTNLLMITVRPESVAPHVRARVRLALAVGANAAQTIARLGDAIDVAPPAPPAPLADGQALAWIRDDGPGEVVVFTPNAPRAEWRRRPRKYAAGELGIDDGF